MREWSVPRARADGERLSSPTPASDHCATERQWWCVARLNASSRVASRSKRRDKFLIPARAEPRIPARRSRRQTRRPWKCQGRGNAKAAHDDEACPIDERQPPATGRQDGGSRHRMKLSVNPGDCDQWQQLIPGTARFLRPVRHCRRARIRRRWRSGPPQPLPGGPLERRPAIRPTSAGHARAPAVPG